MNSQVRKLATLIIFVVSVVLTQAQSRITVNVPFNFQISGTTFPAGQYSVSSQHDQLTIQDAAGKPVFIGMANQVSGRHVGPTGQLIFHCYQTRCFLSEFWTPTRENGNQLIPSRYEKDLASHERGTEFAVLDHPLGK